MVKAWVVAGLFLGSVAFASPSVPQVPKAIEIGAFDQDLLPAVEEFITQAYAPGAKDIVFRINSPGGSVFLGMEIIQLISDVKRSTGVRTTCVVDWKAYSFGLVFLESGACDVRLMTKRATLLGHNASATVSGNATELEATADFLRELSRAMAEIICARSHVSVGGYLSRVATAEWVLSWREAVAVGFVDGIVEPSAIPPVF